MSNFVEGLQSSTSECLGVRNRRIFASCAALVIICFALSGCSFAETSYPPTVHDLLAPPDVSPPAGRNARQWLADAHDRFRHLLPRDPEPLLTENLTGEKQPAADVWDYFDRKPTNINQV